MRIQDNPLYDQLSALLQKAKTLVAEDIPEARRNTSVSELEVSIIMANILYNMGVLTIWDLVHMSETELGRWRYFNSKYRTMELIDAIDQAIKVLTGEMNASKDMSEMS